MVNRTKTIEFVTDTDITMLTASNNRDKSINIYIPEGNPTFLSCTLRCYANNDLAPGQSSPSTLSSPVLGISDDDVTYDEVTLTSAPATSAEQEYWVFERDVTSYFTTNFDGATPPTSVTWYVRFRNSGVNTNNHSLKLILTYTYDDTATTQIKTVKIPIESDVNELSNTWQTIGGTTAIPAITGSYLPEASVTNRQIWLELFAAGGNNTPHNVQVRVNGGTASTVWDTIAISSYDSWMYATLDITSENLSAARSFEAQSSVTDSQTSLGGFVCVTYEFNASTSTTIHNSVMLPLGATGENGISATDSGRERVVLNVQEPTTLTLKESAVVMFSYPDITIDVGSQTPRAYPDSDTNTVGPEVSFVHRFDSAAANGSWGGTLARGENDFDVEWYASGGSTADWNTYGYLVVNYTSGKATDGVGAHNRSIHWNVLQTTNSETLVSDAVNFADTQYYIQGALAEIWTTLDNVSAPANVEDIVLERLSTEGPATLEHYPVIYKKNFAENSTHGFYCDITRDLLRFPEDPITEKIDITASRKIGIHTQNGTSSTVYRSLGLWVTYHGIHWDWDIAVTNYTGDGSNIDYIISRTSDNVPVFEDLTATGGTDSGIVYDNTLTYRAVAYQSLRAGATLGIAGSGF